MDKDDFAVKSQIQSDIDSVRRLLETGVFNTPVLREFYEPVFISIILKLNDLLQKFDKLDVRLNFKDDIGSGDIDITDLINKVRNAICHLDSGENSLGPNDEIKFVFNVFFGKGNAGVVGETTMAESEYDDDIAFFYGEHRVYLKRHIGRVLDESIETVRKLYSADSV